MCESWVRLKESVLVIVHSNVLQSTRAYEWTSCSLILKRVKSFYGRVPMKGIKSFKWIFIVERKWCKQVNRMHNIFQSYPSVFSKKSVSWVAESFLFFYLNHAVCVCVVIRIVCNFCGGLHEMPFNLFLQLQVLQFNTLIIMSTWLRLCSCCIYFTWLETDWWTNVAYPCVLTWTHLFFYSSFYCLSLYNITPNE